MLFIQTINDEQAVEWEKPSINAVINPINPINPID